MRMEQYGVVKGLSEGEISKLAECEGIIRRGIKTFVEVGDALLTIRDQRLYREQFKTFEAYCREQWGFSRSHANRLIESACVVENLAPMGAKPQSERQVRPLAKLPPSEQPKAWQAANEKAEKEGRKVTAKDVEVAVESVGSPVGHTENDMVPYAAASRRKKRSTIPRRLMHAINVLRREIEIVAEQNWKGTNRHDVKDAILQIVKDMEF